jgi:hypothetical protein
MAGMRVLGLIAAALLLSGAMFFSTEVRLEYFRIQQDGSEFIVTWQTSVEEDVEEFVLMRKTTLTNDFGMAMEASPHGIAKEYLFRDSQVYKAAAEQLDYRLEVVYSNGARETLTTQSINYTSTAIRRTWGSLKALFQ